ncbi:MAG TPA: acetyl-CoA carboxylase biotin carboxyl carrier protein subunit [Clostridiaceae bacterium]|jgi:biotin carboxyl carrier protein|nr:acetyl-CoA carboxylase biotin carboxyl carrier protein subunit [Clostridiaceae bacterium]
MSKYRITLEGKTYEMEVDLVVEDTILQPVAKKEYKEFKGAARDANVNVIDPSMQKPTVSTLGEVTAPMPGTVIRIEKAEGAKVKAGDLVLILEAMKMENEIVAPSDGTIAKMNWEVGGTVSVGEVLFEVK